VTWLLVAVGAAVGAPMRYLIDRGVQARHDSLFPWGTFAANVTGSLILGLIVGGTLAAAVPGSLVALVGTGFCGALTTYSTLSFETVRLLEQRATFYGLLNAGASIVAGLGAASVGLAVAAALWS
jgi:fluoride exporter